MASFKYSTLACALAIAGAGIDSATAAQAVRLMGPDGVTLVNGNCTTDQTVVTSSAVTIKLSDSACISGSVSSSSTSSASSRSSSTSSVSSSSSSVPTSGCGPSIPSSRCIEGVYGTMYVPGRSVNGTSFRDGEVWVVRYPFGGSRDRQTVKQYETAIPGEHPVAYDGALSSIPGSFTQTLDDNGNVIPLPSPCAKFNHGRPSVDAKQANLALTTECPLYPGRVYFWNIRINPGIAPSGCKSGAGSWCGALIQTKILP